MYTCVSMKDRNQNIKILKQEGGGADSSPGFRKIFLVVPKLYFEIDL